MVVFQHASDVVVVIILHSNVFPIEQMNVIREALANLLIVLQVQPTHMLIIMMILDALLIRPGANLIISLLNLELRANSRSLVQHIGQVPILFTMKKKSHQSQTSIGTLSAIPAFQALHPVFKLISLSVNLQTNILSVWLQQ